MNNEKKEQAKDLFFQSSLGRTQIADALQIPRRTLHHWIRQNNWDRQKQSSGLMPSLLAESTYHVIDRFTQQLLKAETITHKDAEALHKFTITVNKLKKGATLNEGMEIFGCFMDEVNQKNPTIAQLVAPFVSDFVASHSTTNLGMFKPVQETQLPEDVLREQELDQQDIEAWIAEGDPIIAKMYPAASPSPAKATTENTAEPVAPTKWTSNDSIPKEKSRVAASLPVADVETYVENFKQMFPAMPEETLKEFRDFYHATFSADTPAATAKAA